MARVEEANTTGMFGLILLHVRPMEKPVFCVVGTEFEIIGQLAEIIKEIEGKVGWVNKVPVAEINSGMLKGGEGKGRHETLFVLQKLISLLFA